MENYSLADIRAVVDGGEGWGGGESGLIWIVLVFLFFLGFGGNGMGYGNTGGNASRDVLMTSAETQKEILKSNYDTLLGFKDAEHQLQMCCCSLNTAIHSEGEATRALIQENNVHMLRERLSVAEGALTSNAIVNNILEHLQPTPRPAFLTCSPYSAYPYPYYGNNFGFNGGGCNGNI